MIEMGGYVSAKTQDNARQSFQHPCDFIIYVLKISLVTISRHMEGESLVSIKQNIAI